jgi:hypothetical protein
VLGSKKRELDRLWDIVTTLQGNDKTVATLVDQMKTVIERLDELTTSKRWRSAQSLACLAAIAGDALTRIK